MTIKQEKILELFEKYTLDIVITDIEMPYLDGLSMAKKIRKQSTSTQIIITTTYANKEYLLEAINLHLIKYIIKPISLPKLNEALSNCEEFLEDIIISKINFNKSTFYDTYIKELINKKPPFSNLI
jgi:YesN/AraC family two-component response regulator